MAAKIGSDHLLDSSLVTSGDGAKIMGTARDGGQMMDPETTRAWRRLQKEVKENVPIVLRGLASSGKRIPRKLYSTVARGCKSLIRRAKEWRPSLGDRKALVSRLARVRLRSPIYKV
jgi:type III secretion system FlhB-like substrate exporter